MKTIRCFWFGCAPDEPNGYGVVPCKRCDNHDVNYSDMVNDTRHERTKSRCKYWLFRRWIPAKCPDCNKRYGRHDTCLPF